MDKEIFVQNIKKLCSLRGIKPTIACRESGAGADLINQMERRGSVPSVERVQLLAQYLGVTTSQLLGEEKPAPKTRDGLSAEPLTPDEQQLLRNYRELNSQGQEYIRQTMHMAVQTYKKSSDLSELEG